MTIARELVNVIRYRLDSSGLRANDAAVRQVERGSERMGRGLRDVERQAERTSGAVGRLGGVLRGLFAGLTVVGIARISDEWASVEGRVGLVTDGVQEQRAALEGLYDIAQRTRQEYAATGNLFQSIGRNAKELELTTAQALALTETIGTTLTIGGGSAASQQAALVQLGQALGTGVLRGEELNSVMEQAPRLAKAIADAFGVPVGQLKKLGEAGKLSSKQLAAGLLKQSEALREEFERMPLTFSGAWVRLSNAFGRQIDKLNRSTGAAKAFYRVTSLLVDNLAEIGKWVLFLGTAAIFTKLSMAARALAASGGFLAATLARFGGARQFGILLGTFARMLAVVTAIYYVFDDIEGWFNGADSLLGRVIGPMNEWRWLIDAAKDGLTLIKDTLGGTAETLTQWLSKWGLIAVIIGGIVAAIGLIPALVVGATVALAAMFAWLKRNWDAIPEWVRKVITVTAGIATGPFGALASAFSLAAQRQGPPLPGAPAGPAPVIGPGGAAFGVTPQGLPRAPGATTTITQAPQVTVHATTPQPAAVAEAAAQGTRRGMSASAMVPNVEAAR